MRRAVVVALGDPRSSDAGTWIDAVAWLRQELSELAFRVTVVDGEDVEGDLARALQEVTPEDELFFHVSGRLAERGVLRTAAGRWLRLQALGDALAARPAGRTLAFAELLHDDSPDDSLLAAEHVSWVVDMVGARARGYSMVASVRATSSPIEGLALTRLYLEAARADGSEGAVLSPALGQQVAELPHSHECAQSFMFVAAGDRREVLRSSPPQQPMLASLGPESLPTFDSEPPASFESQRPPASPNATSLDTRIEEAAGAKQWRRVVELRRERLRSLEPARLRIRELVAVARILQVELDDPRGALEALEEARAIDPARVGVLQALRRGYERLGRWERAFEVLDVLAELSPSDTDRAELRCAQAHIALDRLNDTERAYGLLEVALQHDPAHERALTTFDDLCAWRAQRADSAARPSDPDQVSRPAGHDISTEGAATLVEWASTAAAQAPPAPAETSRDVVAAANDVDDTERRPGRGPTAGAEVATMAVGRRGAAAVHAGAFERHRQAGRIDAAFLAALALEELGAASAEQQTLVEQFRSMGPIRARGTLDAAAWELLRAPGSDAALESLFAAVARAAVAARLEQLVARKRLVALDPARRLDETSTASVVRSFEWAARVLGVPCPALYVVDDVPGEIAAVRAVQPSTAVGPSVLRGRTAKDLAFLAARHLTYYRPEHQVLVYFPTSEDLGRLLAAAIELGSTKALRDAADPAVAGLRARLEAQVTTAERAVIGEAVQRVRGAFDLETWARSVELTAARAGLLLCGDLAAAAAAIRSESRAIAGLSTHDKREDLIAFCSSSRHAELRARFAVTAPESLQPAPPTMHVHSP